MNMYRAYHDEPSIFSSSEIMKMFPSQESKQLANLDRMGLLSALSKHGVILLRGFTTNLNKFSELVERITPKTAIDPARAFFAKNVQLVDSGANELGLHCENGTTPLVPELVWFYCERSADRGSQTTVCDGVEVWKSLSASAQDELLKKRIKFSRTVKNELWVKYVKHHFPKLNSEVEISQKKLDSVFSHIDGANVRLNADGSLYLSQSTYAGHSTFFSSQLAFANSIFGPSVNYAKPEICFEDGEPIPEWLLTECRTTSERFTKEIPWATGDIVIIDNSRVMHGRRQILDLNRKIFTALGFLSSEDKVFYSHLNSENVVSL